MKRYPSLFLFNLLTCCVSYTYAQKTNTIWLTKQNVKTEKAGDRDHYYTIMPNADGTNYLFSAYNAKGKLLSTANSSSGIKLVRNGESTNYNENGTMETRMTVTNDIINEIYRYADGKIIEHVINKNNPPKNPINDPAAKYQEFGSKIDINSTPTPASYAAGEYALNKFIAKTVVYPREAVKQRITGTIYVSLKINIQGHVEAISTIRQSIPFLTDEALRVAKLIPDNWIPAKTKDGKAETGDMVVPIRFNL